MKSFYVPLGLFLAAAAMFFIAERMKADVSVYGPGAIPNNSMVTWANGSTGHVSLSYPLQKWVMTNDVNITGFDNVPVTGNEVDVTMWFTNGQSTNCTIYVTATGVTDLSGAGARSFVVTNGSQRALACNKNDLGFHTQSQPAF